MSIDEIVVATDAGLHARGAEVVLDLGGTDPVVVALALSLLSEGLVELLVLRHPRGAWGARMRASAADRGLLLRRYHEDRLDLTLGRTELGVWQSFFLRYARDGAPEVDHVHVDGTWDQGGILRRHPACLATRERGGVSSLPRTEGGRREVMTPPGGAT